MRRSWIIAGVIAVAATAWVASGQLLGSDGGQQTEEAAEHRAPLPSVRFVEIEAQPMVSDLTVRGRTLADRSVSIRAEQNGRIAEVLVERGESVAADQVLVRIAVNDRQARVDFARALVRQREIQYNAAAQLNQRGYSADTDLAEADALLTEARAQLSLAEIDVARLEIRAPFAGIVDDRMVEVGDYIDIGDAVATLVDLDPIRIAAQVSERHVGEITLGAPARARLLDGEWQTGAVTYVGATADGATRTFAVEVEVANADNRIIEGLTAELHVPLAEVRAHLQSPSVLTLADDGTLGVKALGPDNRVQFLPVEILGDDPQGVWLGGLPDRVLLITVGQEFVIPGQLVEPVAETADAAGRPVS